MIHEWEITTNVDIDVTHIILSVTFRYMEAI